MGIDKQALMRTAGITIMEGAPKRDPYTWDQLDRAGDRYAKNGELVEGKPKVSRLNVRRILDLDPHYRGQIRKNEFTGGIEIAGEPVSDVIETGICLQIAECYGFEASPKMVGEAAALVAQSNAYHPVRDWLRTLRWDGVHRLAGWLPRYVGVAPSDLVSEIGLRWWVSMCARVFSPGCKVDTVLILVGPQGARKSSAFRVIASADWFSDTAVDVRHKDAMQALQGVLIQEWGELDSLRRSDATAVKAFLSAQVDRYRPAYGRHFVTWERQCVIVGSTNEQVFLNDETGSRRYWPVEVGDIDLDALRRDRDQLWAEAVQRYQDGTEWWLPPEVEASRREAAARRQTSDPWLEIVENGVWTSQDPGGFVTVRGLLDDLLKIEPSKWTKGHEYRIASILGSIGWTKGTRRKNAVGDRVVPWYPPKEDVR